MKKNETAGTSSAGTSLQTCTPISASLTHEQGADVAFSRHTNRGYKSGDLNQRGCAGDYQPPAPGRGDQLTSGLYSTFEQKVRFLLTENGLPFQEGSTGSGLIMAKSPVRGEIWVANGDSRCFRSPVRDGIWVFLPSKYPHRVPTGLWKTSGPLFSTHITPLAGLPLRGIEEPINPALQGTLANTARFFFSIKRQIFPLIKNVLPFRGRGFWLTSTILRSMHKSKFGPARASETREYWFKSPDLNQRITPSGLKPVLILKSIALVYLLTIISSCTPTEKPYHPSPESHDPQIVHDLSQALTDVIVHDVFSPPVAARIYAYTHLAAYEALRWDKGTYPSLTAQLRGFSKIPEPQDDGAIHCFPLVAAHAFVGVSKMLVFSDTMLERKVQHVFQKLADLHLPKAVEVRSIAYADKIVAAIAERIKSDNYKETRGFSRYTPKTAAGNWEQTPPDYMDAIEPHWRKILPFVLDSASQFKPIRPAPYSKDPGSPFFKDMMFVYTTSQTLTEEQKAIANFWDCNPFVTHNEGHLMFATKKITPGGHWMGIARIACLKTKADLFKSAQTYALTAVTMNDAFISCWDEKYRSEYVRPETAIRNLKDPKWFPLLQTPPFPEYTSGHSVVSSASAVVLAKLYGDSFAYVDSVEVNYGLPPRSFDSFAAAASEASRSRLYGGIHFLPAIENGVKQGKAVGLFIVHTIITQ
jgi:hypothetical protein